MSGSTSIVKRNVGLIFNIQRFSVHDGPGIRDLIFMKGCPLRCQWCSNPESQNYYPEIAFDENRCIGCGECREVCPEEAIGTLADGKIYIERQLCTNCGKCVEVCPAKAIRLFGEYVSTEEVVKVVEEDGAFYWRSGGGITVSGGEPVSQAEFVHELLRKCQECGIDTAIETTGHGTWEDVAKICQYANLILYDIKHIDPDKHRDFTGITNELILENLKKISVHFPKKPVIVRTPIVPGLTDSDEDIEAIVEFLTGMDNVREYELLPYHGFGEVKYRQLGRSYPLSGLKPPNREQMTILTKIAKNARRACKS